MEASDNDDAGGAAGGAGDQGGQGGPGGPEGQAGAGAGGGGGGGAIPRRGPGGEAVPAAGWPPAHPNELYPLGRSRGGREAGVPGEAGVAEGGGGQCRKGSEDGPAAAGRQKLQGSRKARAAEGTGWVWGGTACGAGGEGGQSGCGARRHRGEEPGRGDGWGGVCGRSEGHPLGEAGLGDEETRSTGDAGDKWRLDQSSCSVLRVPFLCPIEAEAARRALAAYEEPHLQGVQKELSVDGSFLIVRWTAEDSRCLQVSVRSFLDDLALVQQVMQHFGPLFPPMSLPGKGG
ncbi:cancer/testis antigen 1-like [Hippopotamus amphibius kiboko]|uniref:cancer/testis antigen 1-like n=1 Tax=Hippopotamus amphibius kiboko TaxID=575201 RepID=UPI0025954C35|nr:cancer/testis antigen 1-like [Hippopotamus amphibius kiboko]